MKEAAFVTKNSLKWKAMEEGGNLTPDQTASNFIELTDELSYARTFYPGSKTEAYLNQLTSIKFMRLYKNHKLQRGRFLSFWGKEIPLLIAEHKKQLLYSLLFLTLGALIGVFSAASDETYVRLILGDEYMNKTLENISKGDPMAIYKSYDASSSFLFITSNNIKVSFIAFVAGILISAGSILLLISNGIMLGAFQYFFYQKGLLLTSVLSIWVHGTLEITSIVIAGGAGIVLGNSILFPGSYPRGYAFRKGASDGIKIVVALVPFFLFAGALEGFVTRHTFMPALISSSIILLSLALVFTYFIWIPYRLSNKHTNPKKPVDYE
jgi:uncharacterized membrane protein SpoIIM required for sporulation